MHDPAAIVFVSETVFKRDVFSETHAGHLTGRGGERVIRRIVTASPIWTRPLAWTLARREIRALRAVRGIEGTPTLISTDRDGLIRDWLDGSPIQIARTIRNGIAAPTPSCAPCAAAASPTTTSPSRRTG